MDQDKKKSEFEKAIYEIKEICPQQWDTILGELFRMSVPRDEGSENLHLAYVEKRTIVAIIEKLGFKF